MTKHLPATWEDPRKEPYLLNKLTPMDIHADDRYLTRDLPRIKEHGLWYPILVYRIDPNWWHGPYSKWRPKHLFHPDPVVNEDGYIWGVKMGSNRYQCATHMNYDSIDAIMCEDADECVKIGRWFAQCDPLHNPNAPPYMGLFDYPIGIRY